VVFPEWDGRYPFQDLQALLFIHMRWKMRNAFVYLKGRVVEGLQHANHRTIRLRAALGLARLNIP
jgi:hypothetical protein